MREIKFRAWNAYAKQMYDVDLLHIRNSIPQVVPTLEGNYMSLVYQPKVVLMQHTGLKDKNGVEIYEGDVLQFFVGDDEFKAKVEWNDQEAGFIAFYKLSGFTPEDMGYQKDSYVVIGNIYENPELLKEQKP